MAQSFLLIVAGVAIALLALFGIGVLVRASRALRALEEVLITANDEIRETLPEVREGLGNVNDIAAGVNVAMRVTGSGAQRFGGTAGLAVRRLGWSVRATLYGVRVGAGSLASSYGELEPGDSTQQGGAARG